MDYIKLHIHLYINNLLIKEIECVKLNHPPIFLDMQLWIDTIFEKSNIQINTPYTIIACDYWAANDFTLMVNKNYQNENKYINQFCLKHEAKHVINKDSLKLSLFMNMTIGFVSLILFFVQLNLMKKLILMFSGYIANVFYWRYYEGEADRFAFMHATSKRELVVTRQDFLTERQDIVDWLNNIINITKIKLQIKLSYYDYIKENIKLFIFKIINPYQTLCVDMIDFMNDISHPTNKNRALMANYYIDHWEDKHE